MYLLSRMYPSTLCSSLPKRPHGLKFRKHRSPVLVRAGEKEREKYQLCISLTSESSSTSSLSTSFHFATSSKMLCTVVSHHRLIQHTVPCYAVFLFYMCPPVVDYFHTAVLLDPELAHDDVVNAACRICPRVGFVMAADKSTDHRV